MEQKPSQRFIVTRQSVFLDKQLTPTERNIYARICTFEQFFESSQTTAEFFGIKPDTVKKAKAKLERLGYIACVKNTGRGKVYEPVFDSKEVHEALQSRTNMLDRRAQTCTSDVHEYTPIDKKENRNRLDTKVSKAQSHDDEQKEYGNPDINAIFKAWSDAGLPAITSRVQANRRAVYNMLRNKAIGKQKLLDLIQLVAYSQSDPYAPGIPDLETLPRRIGALETWRRRQVAKAEAETKQAEPVYQRRPYDERPAVLDYEPSDEVVSDEFLEQCRKKFM